MTKTQIETKTYKKAMRQQANANKIISENGMSRQSVTERDREIERTYPWKVSV